MTVTVSWCITTSIGGEIKTIFPGALDPADYDLIMPIIRRAVERRIAVEAAIRAGEAEPPPAPAPSAPPPRPPARTAPTTATMTQGEIARAQGYAGEPCSKCGAWRMKQAGHCLACDECGETTGCS